MKANRLFLFAVAAVVLLSSCTKEFYFDDLSEGRTSGRTSERGGVTMAHYDFTVQSGDWQLAEADDGSSYLFADRHYPQLLSLMRSVAHLYDKGCSPLGLINSN